MATPIASAFANLAAAGNTVIIPAQGAGLCIRVHNLVVVMDLAVSIFLAGTVSGALTPTFPLIANGGFVLPFTPAGWFATAAGEALEINLSSAVSGGILLSWTSFLS